MGDDHHRHALRVEFGQQSHDVFAGLGVQCTGRLIGQYQLRAVDQRACDRHPLLLPARQLRGTVVTAFAQTHPLQRRQRARSALGSLDARINHRQFDVFQRAGARQQVELLKDKANAPVADGGQLVLRHRLDLFTGQAVFARARQIQAAQNIHQGRFARPRGAHDGHEVTLDNVQRHATQGVHGLQPHGVGLDQITRFNQRGAHRGVHRFRRACADHCRRVVFAPNPLLRFP